MEGDEFKSFINQIFETRGFEPVYDFAEEFDDGGKLKNPKTPILTNFYKYSNFSTSLQSDV